MADHQMSTPCKSRSVGSSAGYDADDELSQSDLEVPLSTQELVGKYLPAPGSCGCELCKLGQTSHAGNNTELDDIATVDVDAHLKA